MRVIVFLISACLSSTIPAQDHRLTSARLEDDVLRLNVTGNLQAVRHFALPNPPRVVLDLFGIARSIAEMPAPAASSPALEVRTGEHARFLRLVVDLHQDLETYDVRRSGGTIEVGLGLARLPPSQTAVLIGRSPVPIDPSQPPANLAPVVDVAVEAAPIDSTVAPTSSTTAGRSGSRYGSRRSATTRAATASASAAPRRSSRDLNDLTTDELLALIDQELDELEAAGLGQEQSAEELIEQVEAALDANELDRPAFRAPRLRTAPRTEERRRRRPLRSSRPNRPPPARDGEERLPFRFVDEDTARESAAEEPPAEEDGSESF